MSIKELQNYNNVVMSLDKKITPFINKSIYSEIFNETTLNIFKSIIILFIIKIQKINPNIYNDDIILPLLKQSGGVFTIIKKKNNKNESYTFTEMFTLIVIALMFISILCIDISYINNLKGRIFEPTTQIIEEANNQMVPLEPIHIDDSFVFELNDIYNKVSEQEDKNNEAFKIALKQITGFSKSIETIISDSINQAQLLKDSTIFDYTLVKCIKLLVPKNNTLVISSLINDKYNKVINDHRQIVNIRVNGIVDEIKAELTQISEEIQKLNDPNFFKRANNMVQSALIYFISPQAIITTANIKLDKIINIISKTKYIRNDIEAGLEQLFKDGRNISNEYSNQIINDVVVLQYLAGITLTFGSLFLYQLKKSKKNTQTITYKFVPELGYNYADVDDVAYDDNVANVDDDDDNRPRITKRERVSVKDVPVDVPVAKRSTSTRRTSTRSNIVPQITYAGKKGGNKKSQKNKRNKTNKKSQRNKRNKTYKN